MADMPGPEHAEGVCADRIEGRPWIIIVSDDGNRAEGRCARYARLDPEAMRIHT